MARFKVGQFLGPLVKPPVTKTQLVMYSGASGDFNPIHTVDEFARDAGLGGVIAHGMLTMAFVGQMLTDTIGDAGDILRFKIRFMDMVRPGDVVTCTGCVTDVQEENEALVVTCDVRAETVAGRAVVGGEAVFRAPLYTG